MKGNHFGGAEFNSMARERGQKWLDARGRDATALIAMWDITSDPALLQEAAEKFPDDPRVCLAMIGHFNGKAAEALPWIQRLIAAEPKNPQGYYLKAWAQVAGKDRAGAIATLREAAALGQPRNSHVRERGQLVQDAAMASGLGAGHAARLAIGTPLELMTTCRMTAGIQSVLLTEMMQAKATRNEDRLMEITGLGLAVAKGIAGSEGVSLREQRMANDLQIALFSELPDDTPVGEDGRTVGALKSEAITRREALEDAFSARIETGSFLTTASDEVLSAYAGSYLEQGEEAATTLLLEKAREAKGQGPVQK